MVLHEVVTMLILAFLDLVNFDLHPELKLEFQLLKFVLIVSYQTFLLKFKVSLQIFDLILKLFFLLVGFTYVIDVLTLVLILLGSFIFAILFFLFGMVFLFFFHLELSLDLLILTVVEMVVVKMLYLLHVGRYLCAMI